MIELNDAILNLQSSDEASALFNVLLTPKEIKEITNRWRGCQMAVCGTPQRAIRDALHISNSTVARCARVVREAPLEFDVFVSRLGLPGGHSTS